MRYKVIRISVLWTLLALCAIPYATAQSVAAVQQLLDLTSRMATADDPCTYVPQFRTLLDQLVASDPETFRSIKPQLDAATNEMISSCGNTVVPAQKSVASGCSSCSQDATVARFTSECSSGNAASCYRAAAAACQCNLNYGGCGTNIQQLQGCVNTNTASANSMNGGYAIVPSNAPSSAAANPNSGQAPPTSDGIPRQCPDGKGGYIPGSETWSACPAW